MIINLFNWLGLKKDKPTSVSTDAWVRQVIRDAGCDPDFQIASINIEDIITEFHALCENNHVQRGREDESELAKRVYDRVIDTLVRDTWENGKSYPNVRNAILKVFQDYQLERERIAAVVCRRLSLVEGQHTLLLEILAATLAENSLPPEGLSDDQLASMMQAATDSTKTWRHGVANAFRSLLGAAPLPAPDIPD